MDEGSTTSLFVMGVLIVLQAIITLSYGALSNVRISVLKDLAEQGPKGASRRAQRAQQLIEESRTLAISYQLATTLLGFSAMALAVTGLSSLFGPTLAPVIVGAVLVLLTASLYLLMGLIVPEAIGTAHADLLAASLLPVMRVVILLLTPLTAVLLAVARVVSGVFGGSDMVNRVTEEEIMTLVDAGHSGGTIEDEEKEMIFSVLRLNETHASELMVPRIDVVAVEIDTPLDEARALFIDTGFSRIPIYKGNIDHIQGLLYAKDLLTYWHNGNREHIKGLIDLMRPAYFVPEDQPADQVLKALQSRRVHMAIVTDEYGGTAGVVTIENIIEEIIGDIQDEYDINEEAEYLKVSDTEYLVDASIDLDDLNDLIDADIPAVDSDTLGGFIYTNLGRVPEVGEEIMHEQRVHIRVESVDGRRIRKCRVTRLLRDDDTGEIIPVDADTPASHTDNPTDSAHV